jgi:hypothetical protein
MPQFRKKPVVIEARRVPVYDPDGDITEYLDASVRLAEWCLGRSYMMQEPDVVSMFGAVCVEGPHIRLSTLEGDHAALPGDWIIQGVQGEFYPCKPDIFEQTYEEVA